METLRMDVVDCVSVGGVVKIYLYLKEKKIFNFSYWEFWRWLFLYLHEGV